MEEATTKLLTDDLREHFDALPKSMCSVIEGEYAVSIWCSEEYLGQALRKLDKNRSEAAVQFSVRSYGSLCIELSKEEDDE